MIQMTENKPNNWKAFCNIGKQNKAQQKIQNITRGRGAWHELAAICHILIVEMASVLEPIEYSGFYLNQKIGIESESFLQYW